MRTITNPQFNRTQHPTFKFIMGNYIVIIHKLAFYLLEEKKCARPYLLRNKPSSDNFFLLLMIPVTFQACYHKKLFSEAIVPRSHVCMCVDQEREKETIFMLAQSM